MCISSLENVSGELNDNTFSFEMDSGQYVVQVNLIDWNQEPGAVNEDGGPTDIALPDMIVFISDYKDSNLEFRKEIETFRHEDALR